MKIVVVFVYSPVEKRYEEIANKFISSYLGCPAGVEHQVFVILNGTRVTQPIQDKFAALNPTFFEHDDSGWDIGGYIALAKSPALPADCEMMVCFGGHGYVKRAGWLARLVEAWTAHGPGMYGTLGTYEVRPHLNTTGFAIAPELLRSYPVKVVNKPDRYCFEHGEKSFHRLVKSMGYPVFLVTWDGIYPIDQWRLPPNVYRRGDQSNCVTFFNHTQNFEQADPITRNRMSELADVVSDKACLYETGGQKDHRPGRGIIVAR